MPTNQNQNKADLSALLNQTEPPTSPDHLDDLILKYARDNVPESSTESSWQILSMGKQWLNQNWISAMATFSVAAIAVSVTLQSFESSLLDQASLSPSAELQLAAIDETEVIRQESVQPQAAQSLALSVSAEPVSQAANTAAPVTRQLANTNRSAMSRASNTQLASNDAVSDSVLEEVVVTGAAVSGLAAAATSVPDNQDIEFLLVNDPVSRTTFIAFLDQVLNNFEQAERIASPATTSAAEEARLLVIAFNELADASAEENRYNAARVDFTAFELPASLEDAIELLDSLEF
jgi:hypothetical protein